MGIIKGCIYLQILSAIYTTELTLKIHKKYLLVAIVVVIWHKYTDICRPLINKNYLRSFYHLL